MRSRFKFAVGVLVVIILLIATMGFTFGGTLPYGVQGDILYHSGWDWVALNAGDSGKYLKSQGAGANPMWDTPPGGGGDMTKAVYDADADNMVNTAEDLTGNDVVQSANIDWGAAGDQVDADDVPESATKKWAGESGADVTDATNVDAAGATMNVDTSLAGNGYFLDEDNMISNSATKAASQQSIKAYVDAQVVGSPGTLSGWVISGSAPAKTKALGAVLAAAGYNVVVCDGYHDFEDWDAVDNAASGGIIYVSEGYFDNDGGADVTLTSKFVGQGAGLFGDSEPTTVNTGATTITLTKTGGANYKYGDLNDMYITGNAGANPVVKMLAKDGVNGRYYHQYGLLDGIVVSNPAGNQTSTGIQLNAVSAVGQSVSISMCSFGNIGVTGFLYGLHPYANEAAGGDAYINGNTFASIRVINCDEEIRLDSSDNSAEVMGNIFPAVQLHWASGVSYGIRIVGDAQSSCNKFTQVMCWEWESGISLYIPAGCANTYAAGHLPGLVNASTDTSNMIWLDTMPTADPAVEGVIWVNNNVLTRSNP